MVVRCAGGTDEHAAISSNLNAAFHASVGSGPCFVRGSDRKLVPRDIRGRDLGSFYADLFVSCEPADRRGDAAHFPTIVIEVLSSHVGAEFTRKKDAYLGSARLTDYYVIDSTRRYVARYFWAPEVEERGRLFIAEYRRGPLPVPALGLELTFEQIYAGTSVPSIIHPIRPDDQEAASQIRLDTL